MDVALECSRLNGKLQSFVEKLDEAMQAVVGCLIALINQRIGAFELFDRPGIITQRAEIGIVIPEFRTSGPDVGEELLRVTNVQISHRRG